MAMVYPKLRPSCFLLLVFFCRDATHLAVATFERGGEKGTTHYRKLLDKL
jgi:hypothetical protein